MSLNKIFFKDLLLFIVLNCPFVFSVYARSGKYSFEECKTTLKQCFSSYDHGTGKINSTDKLCSSKGKLCLSTLKELVINCDKVLDPCFQNSCSGASCSDIASNENLGMSCLINAGVQYQYRCYSKLKTFSVSYASRAKSFADAEASRLKQMELQSKQQTEQAQIQAQAEQSRNQIASQERIKMAELQLQKEEAERQSKEREQERLAQEKANRDPNSDIIVRLNGLKKFLNSMEKSVSEAKDISGYVKYKLSGANPKLNNDLMWFRPSRNILSSLKLAGTGYIYNGNKFNYNGMDVLDSDAMQSMVADNAVDQNQSDSKIYYTCSKNINTGILHVPLSNYYKQVQDFLSNFEDIILIAKDSPDAMAEIDFTCVDSVQVFVQPLNEYINELASINKTALCRFDSSSFMNALQGMGGIGSSGLPRGKDGRFMRLDVGNKNKKFALLNAIGVSDDTNLGGEYNTDLVSTDDKTDSVAGAKIARAVGYASDINRALAYCYMNTLHSMKRVITSKRNINQNSTQQSFGGVTGLIARIGNLTRVENGSGNNKTYSVNNMELTALCNDISDYAVMKNISDKYQQYNTCKVCTNTGSGQDYNIVVNSLRSCVQSLVNTSTSGVAGMMQQGPG